MSIEAHKTILVTSLDLAKDLVVSALKKDSCKVDVESDSVLHGKRGSQLKLRTIGALFLGIKDYPVKITVQFTSMPSISQVDISAWDDLGFGSMAGMTEKYEKAVLDLLEVVTRSIQSVTIEGKISDKQVESNGAVAAEPNVSETNPVQNSKSFCSNCGSKLEPSSKFCSSCGQKL